MKKMTYFVMALAMVLGLTQCKKEQTSTTQNESEGVFITLDVEGGSRHQVVPGESTAPVNYEDGDVIYVGDGSTYIGTLTRTEGVFSGEISEPSGDKLHFYFVGGLEPIMESDLTAGTTPSFTVDLSDQSSNLPVISYNSVDYTGPGSYSCQLKNKCALVKFTLATGTTEAVSVAGMKTEATISFSTPGITPTETTGTITLNSVSETEKWAILLPQDAVNGAAVTIGSDNLTANVPAVAANGYLNSGIAIPPIAFTENFDDGQLPTGWTTIDADGDGFNWVFASASAGIYNNNNDVNGGHNGSYNYLISGSWTDIYDMALTPDNYLVTSKVHLVNGSHFSFWAAAHDSDYPNEHFGVCISDDGTNWDMLNEWTLTAKGERNEGPRSLRNKGSRGLRDGGNWYKYEVDLSAYAGDQKYIAIRHFGCSDVYLLDVDDIKLEVVE